MLIITFYGSYDDDLVVFDLFKDFYIGVLLFKLVYALFSIDVFIAAFAFVVLLVLLLLLGLTTIACFFALFSSAPRLTWTFFIFSSYCLDSIKEYVV